MKGRASGERKRLAAWVRFQYLSRQEQAQMKRASEFTQAEYSADCARFRKRAASFNKRLWLATAIIHDMFRGAG